MTERKAQIRKNCDRRLYDSGARRYVNLDDIARMLRDGVDVEVRDARTGKDITRVILTQIIMQGARNGEAGLPLNVLRQLVQASDRAAHELLSWYLETASEVSRKAGGALLSRVSEAKSAVSSPVEFLRNLIGGQPAPAASANAEIEDLRRQVRDLEARLAPRKRRSLKR